MDSRTPDTVIDIRDFIVGPKTEPGLTDGYYPYLQSIVELAKSDKR